MSVPTSPLPDVSACASTSDHVLGWLAQVAAQEDAYLVPSLPEPTPWRAIRCPNWAQPDFLTPNNPSSAAQEGFEHSPVTSAKDFALDLRVGVPNGERTARATREVTVQRSDADDVDEIAESGEVVRISGVVHEAVGVRGGGDE